MRAVLPGEFSSASVEVLRFELSLGGREAGNDAFESVDDVHVFAKDVVAEAGELRVGELVPSAAGTRRQSERIARERLARAQLDGLHVKVSVAFHLSPRKVSAPTDVT